MLEISDTMENIYKEVKLLLNMGVITIFPIKMVEVKVVHIFVEVEIAVSTNIENHKITILLTFYSKNNYYISNKIYQ